MAANLNEARLNEAGDIESGEKKAKVLPNYLYSRIKRIVSASPLGARGLSLSDEAISEALYYVGTLIPISDNPEVCEQEQELWFRRIKKKLKLADLSREETIAQYTAWFIVNAVSRARGKAIRVFGNVSNN